MITKERNPGVEFNSKVVIFDNHLSPIYITHGNNYLNMARVEIGYKVCMVTRIETMCEDQDGRDQLLRH